MKTNNEIRKASAYKHPVLTVRCWSIALVLIVLAIIVYLATLQYDLNFGLPFESLLFTLTLSKEGADVDFVVDLIFDALPKLVLLIGVLAILAYCFLQTKVTLYLLVGTPPRRINLHKLSAVLSLIISIPLLVSSILYADRVVGFTDYYEKKNLPDTTVYETYFADPNSVMITPPAEQKNLIYIYLESMETQYASIEEGGTQPVNYIPNATALAKNNVSFSNTDKLGGFYPLPGSTWTMASLFATQTGLPFAFPVGQNDMSQVETFAPSVVGLGDILEEQGYHQEFLCGSDIRFAGRDKFFRDHGGFEIYDYYTAVENDAIPDGHYVFWGYEDKYLYEIAKSELEKLSQLSQPFNFTMLTVDAHHWGGYVCDLCRPEGDSPDDLLAAVISCADQQLAGFLEWVKQQPFYEDTVIVITGDHPRMDTILVKEPEYLNRTMYNCFINSQVQPDSTTFRQFAPMDMFPTVLAAMGYQIEGDRLGLGTNLFSQTPTLVEEHSLDFWNTELQKRSDYFTERFAH